MTWQFHWWPTTSNMVGVGGRALWIDQVRDELLPVEQTLWKLPLGKLALGKCLGKVPSILSIGPGQWSFFNTVLLFNCTLEWK